MIAIRIPFDSAAAQDALARADEGVAPMPGDRDLIAAYEAWCQQAHDQYEAAVQDQAQADWLARQCPYCQAGGTGDECDDHYNDREDDDR